jgi:hypothetical protein
VVEVLVGEPAVTTFVAAPAVTGTTPNDVVPSKNSTEPATAGVSVAVNVTGDAGSPGVVKVCGPAGEAANVVAVGGITGAAGFWTTYARAVEVEGECVAAFAGVNVAV